MQYHATTSFCKTSLNFQGRLHDPYVSLSLNVTNMSHRSYHAWHLIACKDYYATGYVVLRCYPMPSAYISKTQSIHTMWLPSTTAIHISLPCNQFTNLTISPLDLYFFHFAHKSSIIRENDDSNGNRVLRPEFSQI